MSGVFVAAYSYGKSASVPAPHRGEQFRLRVLSMVEICKKRELAALDVISDVVSSVIRKQSYPDVLNFINT
ncbi:hypothetical protein [Candidatus Enterovibrio escicola]|nr:hypothetical protein [Candidatus Enterovibrio escacola]